MKAQLEIESENPEMIIKSLEPDIEETTKFNIKLNSIENKILLTIESKDITGLLAGINSYLRLIRTALEVKEVS